MKYFTTFILLLTAAFLQAQVTFVIDSIPADTPEWDNLFIAGDFNGWNPGDTNYILLKNEQDRFQISLETKPEGTTIQFKFTRGSWETVEKGPNGEETDNRTFTYGNGDTIHMIIYNWRHNGGDTSTAAANVHIIDDNFYMPQLDKTRRIWIYLPPDYETSEKRYPVIYMQDGQNLFDDKTSFAGEWHVDETLNSYHGIPVPIVVGIDNGGADRINEYSPWINPEYGGGEGEKYAAFIAETLKPYIDSNYRTISDDTITCIMGSSMGALISHYISIKYENAFGKVGLFSPSYWFSDSVYTFTQNADKQNNLRLYFMCGSEEGETMINDMHAMEELLNNIGHPPYNVRRSLVVDGGQHNEKLWSEQFGEAYQYLYEDWLSSINKKPVNENFNIFPNPVSDKVHFPDDIEWGKHDSLVLSDVAGRILVEINNFNGNPIPVCGLSPGVYFITIKSSKVMYNGQFIKN